ncbi:hypothetical protein Tco_0168144 [Tanacetum coccineum]
MRSNKLYKFSDGTLTTLLSSLEDITKNIDMEYLPKRRWSTLENKRAQFMINNINKLLKERRMMRSLEKFVGAGNLVKKILPKLNLSDHKSILMDLKEHVKMVMEALIKDEETENVDVHLYRSMIGSLMCLITSRPDVMFAVCACARFQVTPKTSHLHAMKMIFRYLKGQPKLGLWYPRDSPFDLEAFSDSDYAGASLDKKSTTGGCQLLGKRLISWQCKKQTIVANTTIEVDTICIVKNPVFHSKTKHIEIRHHFIRDTYEKKLIQVIKIHTKHNVSDLLTKDLMLAVDFLSTCSINYALTVSPTIYASYIEQFWNTSTSKIVNSVKQIHAIVDGKAVVISESSVRNDLFFDDKDGITCLTNDDIFENLALMGSVPALKTKRGVPAQTRSERVLKQPNESPLPEGHTSGSA